MKIHLSPINIISMLAQAHFPPTELHGVSASTRVDMLARKGVDWEKTPPFFRYGTYVKKEEFEKATSQISKFSKFGQIEQFVDFEPFEQTELTEQTGGEEVGKIDNLLTEI